MKNVCPYCLYVVSQDASVRVRSVTLVAVTRIIQSFPDQIKRTSTSLRLDLSTP